MEINVDRYVSDEDTTLSRVFVDGSFACFGLEDEYREDKVPGKTRIPAGAYRVTLRAEGKMYHEFKNRFPGFHKGMLHIRDVPGFEYVLIHIGNTDEDTRGCLLIGTQANNAPGNMSISNSKIAYELFYPMVVSAAENDDLKITFEDND